MNLLSDFDVAVLQAARRVLEDLEPAAYRCKPGADDYADESDTGRLAGAAGVTHRALFDVLGTAANYMGDEAAKRALDNVRTPSTAAVVARLRELMAPELPTSVPE